MNNKHIAALLVGLAILGVVQGTLTVKKNLAAVQTAEQKARTDAQNASTQVQKEQLDLQNLRNSTRQLITFLDAWEPFFTTINTPEGAELAISTRLKEDNLMTLAQRYQPGGVQGSTAIPRSMRANLTIEDDFARTLNWLGRVEQQIPTLRIATMRLAKGQLANDVRIELVTEIPLASAPK